MVNKREVDLFFGDTLYQRDKIKKNIIMTTYYYPDKLLMAKGQSRLDITKDGKRALV